MNGSIKTDSEINYMRKSGHMLAKVLEVLKQKSAPGLTPKQLSRIAKEELLKLGGEPAFLGYYDYPDIICISVNDEVQHSIPNDRQLSLGDVVNYDFGVRYKGMITDAGITVCIGGNDYLTTDSKRLIEGTRAALYAAIDQVRDGVRVGHISNTIEQVLKSYHLSIVQELVGHGVGRDLHEDPEVPNYGSPAAGPVLRSGMTIAIEPICTVGSPRIKESKNGWTLSTVDGSLSAQFEHTVLVKPKGFEILTSLDTDLL